ncbi:MAG: sugar phosphate isomerase/epimerase [Anaerolineae bacterium]|nr:sugar phosphate isomerase/epimerase [Anaerolineae bacterium]
MTKPIALQLYTLREALEQDFDGVIRKVAEMGYLGVETAGFPNISVREAAQLFKSLELQVVAAHSGLPLGDAQADILNTMATLECNRLVIAYVPPDQFQTVDQIKHVCENLNEGSKVARANGMTLFYHNHWWEYEAVDGQYPYQIMQRELDPAIQFEVDTYWVQTAGHNPTDVIRELGNRAPLLHIKDGPCVKDVPMTAAGEGMVDIPGVVAAAEDSADWMIVEIDHCATDMQAAVQKSYQYLTTKGLAHGRSS